MTTKTAPWAPQALTAPVDSYQTTLEVNLYIAGKSTPYVVQATEAKVDFVARRSPTVHAELTLAWPSADIRKILDPRIGLEVEILAGYRYLGTGMEDTQRVCRLRVQEANVKHRDRTVELTADSDEVIPIGYAIETAVSYSTSSGIVDAIKAVVAAAFVGETLTWVVGEDVPKRVTFDDTQDLTPGEDRWNYVQDWADSIGVVVWHDGLGNWRIDNAEVGPSAFTVANLKTGPRGTLISVETTETLDGYANRAAAVYEYTIGSTSYRKTAVASTSLTPRQMVTKTMPFKPHNSGEVARQMLLRALRRGHNVTVEAASYLWVRPGYSITASLDDGTQERLLVESATFDLAAGSMTLTGQSADGAPFGEITTTVTTTTL